MEKKCKCGGLMFVDEWNGWVWRCVTCDRVMPMTDAEFDKLEENNKNHLTN